MNLKVVFALITTAVLLLVSTISFFSAVGHNNDQNWQILQSVGGEVTVIDTAGYYWKGFGTVWTYPRTMEAFYSNHPEENDGRDQSVSVTFNDGGNAKVSAYARVELPTTVEKRRLLHRDFQGNPANIKAAIRAHLVNAVKASGPVMSASENQSSRKAEFNQTVEEQLAKGLFKMRRTEIELSDLTEIEEIGIDAQGNKITREKKAKVQATEIVQGPDAQPIVIQVSPLLHYGLGILQFSITDTEYDEQTLKQFSAKKESYLNAEKSKAQRQEEVQQRLMVEEMGRRQIAEIQAVENQKKEKAVIGAQQAAEVAKIDKDRAVTEGERKVLVAKQSKLEAQTVQETAKIEAETAELRKQATISAAEAQQKAIELGGGISEEKRVLAEIGAKRDQMVAEALAKIGVPSTLIIGGGEKGGTLTENLLNIALLKSTGVLKDPAPTVAK